MEMDEFHGKNNETRRLPRAENNYSQHEDIYENPLSIRTARGVNRLEEAANDNQENVYIDGSSETMAKICFRFKKQHFFLVFFLVALVGLLVTVAVLYNKNESMGSELDKIKLELDDLKDHLKDIDNSNTIDINLTKMELLSLNANITETRILQKTRVQEVNKSLGSDVDKIEIELDDLKTQFKAQNLYPPSCAEVTGPSGLYTIQPVTLAPAFQVYCDMDTDGGGWTLIASIHENNIDGKCTPGDKWSSEQGTSHVFGIDLGNWENTNTFGYIDSVTSQDYKNPAYHVLNSSNLMLWHVPNQKQIYEINEASTLKYYTTNGFLNKSTMQNYYAKSYSVLERTAVLEDILTPLQRNQQVITSKIPNWYNYRYDSASRRPSLISNGGNNMYHDGNRVSFRTNRERFTNMVYNASYMINGRKSEVRTIATYPFVALAWIGNNLGINGSDYFEYRVTSNYGTYGGGSYAVYTSNEINQGQMSAKYTAFLVYNAGNPSICEVYFYISSAKWNSRSPLALVRIGWMHSTRSAQNTVRFTGQPNNVFIGYTLLSKTNGRIITPLEIDLVLLEFMSIARSFQFNLDISVLVDQVTYAKGNNESVLNGIPKMFRNTVIPGYIQILAINSAGFFNALCPGIAMTSNNAERMCIGGESTSQIAISTCGDFAGWKGMPGDPGEETQPSNTGKSLSDINSSILMFVR